MKILHYALGFSPYRTGGLTKFCMDLMLQQNKAGHQTALLWPGKMGFLNHGVSVKNRGIVKADNIAQGTHSYEIINPLAVPYDEGICKFDAFMRDAGKTSYEKLLDAYKPEVIHIHTLMGLHKSFLTVAKERRIRMVFTAHDYFPICPKVTLFRNGQACQTARECLDCGRCNASALSITKIWVLQSRLYRILKDSLFIRKLRKRHRDAYLGKSHADENALPTGPAEDYRKLRNYYYALLQMMDIIHYNSSITKSVYEQYFQLPSSAIIGISHADIADHRRKREFSRYIRFTYLGTQSEMKGYFVIREALDKLWEESRDFELNVYFEPKKPAPYVKSYPRYSCDALGEVMERTDVLLVPSIGFETFGFTVLEALSYGVPVIISGNVGAKDILTSGMGIVVENMDGGRLYEVLKEITPAWLEQMNRAIVETFAIPTLTYIVRQIEWICYELPATWCDDTGE